MLAEGLEARSDRLVLGHPHRTPVKRAVRGRSNVARNEESVVPIDAGHRYQPEIEERVKVCAEQQTIRRMVSDQPAVRNDVSGLGALGGIVATYCTAPVIC